MSKKNKILVELLEKQKKDVDNNIKLQYDDLRRITKYINTSIFSNNCCVWTGHVANTNNKKKCKYINFYFKNKKVALHRLLYSNYIGPLKKKEYLKFSCNNRGLCCNVTHLEKHKYSTISNDDKSQKKNKKKVKKNFEIVFD